jgi:bifunctional aspartokinase / homoserine dehydrogenase 1
MKNEIEFGKFKNSEVHKFGGTIIGSSDGIRNILDITEEKMKNLDYLFLIVSASFGVTDYLYSVIEEPHKFYNDLDIHITTLHKHFKEFLKESTYNNVINTIISQIVKYIEDKDLIIRSIKRKLVSIGEIIAANLLYYILKELGKNVSILNPEEVLVTNEVYNNATIDLEESKFKLLQIRNDNISIYIVPGFFTKSHKGVFTLLGRSGTDYTATALAAVIEAKAVHIWKSVDGFMTADPHLISNAKTVKLLDYQQAIELSHFGAICVHHKALSPLIDKQIPLFVKNINSVDRETLIYAHQTKDDNPLKSISYTSEISKIIFEIMSGGTEMGIIEKIAKEFRRLNINILSISTSSASLAFVIHGKDLKSNKTQLIKLRGYDFIQTLDIQNGLSLIAVVGTDLKQTPGIAAKIFSLLFEENINLEFISCGASNTAIHFCVQTHNLEKSLNKIHKHYFETNFIEVDFGSQESFILKGENAIE